MGEEPSSGWARLGGVAEREKAQSGGLGHAAASADDSRWDEAWRAVAPGVRVRAEAGGGRAGGAEAGSRRGIVGAREVDGPSSGGRGGPRRVGAVLAAAAVIVLLVRIAAVAPNGSIPTTSAPPTAMASELVAATDLPVEVSPPAAAMSPGPTEWVDSAAPATGPTSTPGGPPDPDPPTEPTADVGVESPAPVEGGPVDWWSVLAQLDQARASALAAREVSALDAYAVPDSPAWNQDSAIIGDLRARGLAPIGLTTRVVGIERAPEESDHGPGAVVELVIVDERSSYSLVDDGGSVVDQIEASGLRRWRVRLASSESTNRGSAWLLHSIEPMP